MTTRLGSPSFRHQLPTYSPLSLSALARAVSAMLGDRDPRQQLVALLERVYEARVQLCGSGTDALTRAIIASDALTGRSGIVALPAYGCYDLATAALGAGTRIVLYDIDPSTLAPDLASLTRALDAGARVVVAAPLYGLPIDWSAITQLAERAGAMVIEDAAQAYGATWQGRALGTLGEISILGFGRGKGWTGSHGGALLVRGPRAREIAEHVVVPGLAVDGGMRDVVAAFAQYLLGRPSVYALPASIPWLGLGETRFRPPSPSKEQSRASAALLLATREAALDEGKHRHRAAETYRTNLEGTRGIECLQPVEGSVPGYLRFAVRVTGGFEQLAERRRALALGIAPAYPTLLDALPAVRPHLARREVLPGATTVRAELITLPTHSRVSAAERDAILTMLREQHALRLPANGGLGHSAMSTARPIEHLDARGGI